MNWNYAHRRILFMAGMATFLSLGLFSGQASTVYVFLSGNSTADFAVVDGLRQGDHEVTPGIRIGAFDGTQADLSQYDVVVIINNYSYAGSIPAGGQTALNDFVSGGGGLVVGEWGSYYASGFGLSDILPVVSRGYNTAPSTTYDPVDPDPIINDDLPDSFSFNLANVGGSEDRLDAKDGASVFYSSRNGGGMPNSVGVAGWDILAGRVISISTLITEVELLYLPYKQLLQNMVRWARNVDLAITNDASPDPVQRGANITYTLKATSNGPNYPLGVTVTSDLAAETTFQSLTAPADWFCETPDVGQTGTVTCIGPSLDIGATATFTLVVKVNDDAQGPTISNTATVRASAYDPDPNSNTATATVTLANQ